MHDSEALRDRKTVSRGTLWSAADFWLQQSSQLLTFLVVGSLLGPHIVGVMTMALLAVAFLMTFMMGGFADALVQRAELRKDHFDTAFWLLFGMGVGGAILLALGAPLVAWLFSEPELTTILPVLALSLPCIGISAVFQGMLQRELRFRQLATRSMIAYTTAFIVALVMAKAGMGVWSLIASFLVGRALDALLVMLVSKLKPGLSVTRAALAEIVGYGKHRVGTQLMGFIGFQIDRIMIGIFLGPVALGFFSIAERMVSAFTYGVSGVIQRVAFPVLSMQQDSGPNFDRALRQFTTLGNIMSLPIFFGIAVTSRELIDVLLSDNWRPAAAPLAILSVAAIAHATNYSLTTATNALGRSDVVLRYSVVVIGLRVAACLIAAQFSMVAVALANLAVFAISPSIIVTATNRIFGGKWPYYVMGSWPTLLAGLIMVAVTLAVGVLISGYSTMSVLAIKVAVGVASYLIAIRILAPETFRRAVTLITARA
jgi:PST family polysaccharide transporter